jgi:hypothetical protein
MAKSGDNYENMITPRNQSLEKMERVNEEDEGDFPHEESKVSHGQ